MWGFYGGCVETVWRLPLALCRSVYRWPHEDGVAGRSGGRFAPDRRLRQRLQGLCATPTL
ncbi:hypothetical protein C4K25_5574 [Pseudomonas chlororaphis]|nr:hypothetical protein C4K25_5574 [Pseudomonas chlororaphis]